MITIKYSCFSCGIDNAEVQVRYREPAEDVIHWMKTVVEPGLAEDHNKRSLYCNPTELYNVMIPIQEGAEYVGGPVRH